MLTISGFADSQVISSNPASVAGMFFLANFGTACYSQTAASITVRNFPASDRGKVRNGRYLASCLRQFVVRCWQMMNWSLLPMILAKLVDW